MSLRSVEDNGPSDWTSDFAEQAMAEGWGLDDSHQIVRDDDAAMFATDEAALEHVRARALRGSVLHATALTIHVKAKQ